MGPQNDLRFSKTRTTLLQAPKAIVARPVDTLFTLINARTSFDYRDEAHMEYWLLAPRATRSPASRSPSRRGPTGSSACDSCSIDNGLLDSFIAAGGLGMILGLSRTPGSCRSR